jgi:predicted RNase H-like nuclease (RuvC/YqgF family)
MLKLLTSALLIFGATTAASADSYRTHQSHRTSSYEARVQLKSAEAAQRAASTRVANATSALRDSEQDLRSLQVKLNRSIERFNVAQQQGRVRQARQLERRIDRLTSQASDAEMRRDEARARLDVARMDFQRAKDNVYTASARVRYQRGG